MPTIDLANLDPSLIPLLLITSSALLFLLIVAALIARATRRRRRQANQSAPEFLTPQDAEHEGPLPYQPVPEVLTPAERSFYRCLQQAIGQDLDIFPKMRLADVFKITTTRGEFWEYFNKISAKHVDFLLCDMKASHPRLIIELDDSSHNRRRRQERDEFLNRVCADAGLPILHQPAQMAYNTKELRQSIIDRIVTPKTDPKDS